MNPFNTSPITKNEIQRKIAVVLIAVVMLVWTVYESLTHLLNFDILGGIGWALGTVGVYLILKSVLNE